MTKQKRKKNKLVILIFTVLFLYSYTQLLEADELTCNKFDIKCKTKKFIDDTKKFQKKGLTESKEQLSKTKSKVIPKIK